MEPGLLIYKNSTIAYYRFGLGPKPVICFHGYGEDAASFEFFSRYVGDQFSFLCIDLPFHGKTEWKEGLNFNREDLLHIIEGILEKETFWNLGSDGDRQTPGSKLSLMGFSLGGRVALSFYQLIPQQVDKMLLLAPDGLKVNFWYWFSTQTGLGNKFFAFTMTHPRWFFWFVKFLHKIRLVNTSIFKFVNYYVDNKSARDLLYSRWTCLRKLKPSLPEIKKDILTNKTPVTIIYGRHDRIILSSVGEKFKKGIETHCTITILPSGHQVLHEKHAADIIQALLR